MLLMAEQEAQLLTPAQVAKRLQVHRDTVLRWIREEKLVGTRVGRQMRIHPRDLEDFLQRENQSRRSGETGSS